MNCFNGSFLVFILLGCSLFDPDYNGRTKYSACASKLSKMSGAVLGSDTQKCIVYSDTDTQFLRKKSNKAIQFCSPKFLSPMNSGGQTP